MQQALELGPQSPGLFSSPVPGTITRAKALTPKLQGQPTESLNRVPKDWIRTVNRDHVISVTTKSCSR